MKRQGKNMHLFQVHLLKLSFSQGKELRGCAKELCKPVVQRQVLQEGFSGPAPAQSHWRLLFFFWLHVLSA